MVKAWLHDDVTCDDVVPGVTVALSEDGGAVLTSIGGDTFGQVGETNPVLTVRVRGVDGYDGDGNPQFVWLPVVSVVSTLTDSRAVVDDRSGMTTIQAAAVVPYDGTTTITETATVTDSDGWLWRVAKVTQFPDRLEMTLSRVVDDS